jgi:CBS domain-containing protein
MSIQNVMTREVITLNVKDKVRVAWTKLMERDISGAPVVDDEGIIVGMLSMSDINRSILERFQKARALREATAPTADETAKEREETKELSLAMRAVTDSPVSSLLPMNQKVAGLGPLDSLDRAIKMMADGNVNRLPVVKAGKVVGVLSRQDVIMILAGKSRF